MATKKIHQAMENDINPVTDREIMIALNGKVDKIDAKIDFQAAALTDALNRISDAVIGLEKGKVENHEVRIQKLEDKDHERDGSNKSFKAISVTIITIAAIIAIISGVIGVASFMQRDEIIKKIETISHAK
jgi:hypothetical protein